MSNFLWTPKWHRERYVRMLKSKIGKGLSPHRTAAPASRTLANAVSGSSLR